MLKVFLLVCLTVSLLVNSFPLDDSVIEEHIVGGNDTDISQVPHQIAMYENDVYMCGGSILSPTFILTAAHCVYGSNDNKISIRAGSSSNKEGGVVVKVKKVYRHSKHSIKPSDYDVAVLELETPLKLNDKTIKSIKLASKEPSANSVVLVSGWGFIDGALRPPKTLQSVKFPVYDRVKCTAAYKEFNVTITPRMICAGAQGKSAYYGDSGGALVHNGEVAGIVSFGIGCGRKDLPGVYTNVANPDVTKFIKDVTKL